MMRFAYYERVSVAQLFMRVSIEEFIFFEIISEKDEVLPIH